MNNNNPLAVAAAVTAAAAIVLAGIGTITAVTALNAVHSQPQPPTNVGSVTGPDLPFSYLGVGGVRSYKSRTDSLNQASTTACSMQTPNATTSLRSLTFNELTGTSTATIVTVATSTVPSASTTPLMTYSVDSTALANIAYAPTTSQASILAPNTYVNVTIKGGTGTFSLSGDCQLDTLAL